MKPSVKPVLKLGMLLLFAATGNRRGDRIASRLERRSERFDRRWDSRH